jgi:hypothetical protein
VPVTLGGLGMRKEPRGTISGSDNPQGDRQARSAAEAVTDSGLLSNLTGYGPGLKLVIVPSALGRKVVPSNPKPVGSSHLRPNRPIGLRRADSGRHFRCNERSV